MVSYRMYKQYKGVYLPRSPLSIGSNTYTYFLMDDSFTLGSNFPLDTESYAVPPYNTSGPCLDKTFICRSPFDKRARLDGPVEGNILVAMESDSASYSVHMTKLTITLYAVDINGNVSVIMPEYQVYPNGPSISINVTTATKRTWSMYFTNNIDAVLEPNARIALRIKSNGYRTSSSSTALRHYLEHAYPAGDVLISIPYVGL
jgi:hypothetical protein